MAGTGLSRILTNVSRGRAETRIGGRRIVWDGETTPTVHHGHGHKFDPSMRDHLLDPKRARYLPAKEILSKFPMKVNGAAVDIGCGPGYWTIPMAQLLGPTGRVYAVDLEETMLAALRERLDAHPGLDVQALRSTEERLPLPERSVDFAFLACVLHELDGPGTLREAARVLRPGGVLGIVEWKKKRQLEGPPYRIRLSPAKAAKVLEDGGFDSGDSFEVGPHHYGISATPKPL